MTQFKVIYDLNSRFFYDENYVSTFNEDLSLFRYVSSQTLKHDNISQLPGVNLKVHIGC